jgi:hypothetical protein
MVLDEDDLLEDVDTAFDSSKSKSVIKLAMRMAEIVRSETILQNGKWINYEALVPGAKVYFYKPPSEQEVEKRGRKAKHLFQYTGPATILILRSVGTRSFVIQYTNEKGVIRTYQRDASMISLIPPKYIKNDPSDANHEAKPPHLHQTLALSPIEKGEYVFIKDTKGSKTWYCTHVLENCLKSIG